MINIFYQFLRSLFNICLLRASPAEIPFSNILLTALVGIEFGLNIFTLHKLKGASTQEIVLATFLSLFVLIGLLYVLLSKRKLQSRLHKVLMAWFGTELILTAFLQLILFILPDDVQTLKSVQVVIEVVFFAWNIAIKAYIVRLTFDMKLASAILLTFGVLVVSSLPIQFILGAYLPQTIQQSQGG